MTSRAILSLALAGLLTGSPVTARVGAHGSWAIDIDRDRINLAAQDAPTREIVLAIVEHFDIRFVEHAPINGTTSTTLIDESLHAVLGQLLQRHSFQLFAASTERDGPSQSSVPSTLWIFSSSESRAPAATAFLEAALYRGNQLEKREAIRELGRLESTASIHALSLAMADSDKQIRELALSTLEEIDHPEALAAIASSSQDADPKVRGAAAEALASGNRANAVRYLEHALQDPDPLVRQMVVESLGEIPLGTLPNEKVVAALNQALLDSDPEVRMAAVDALENVGGSIAFNALMRAKLDADARVAENAKEALDLRSR